MFLIYTCVQEPQILPTPLNGAQKGIVIQNTKLWIS